MVINLTFNNLLAEDWFHSFTGFEFFIALLCSKGDLDDRFSN